MTDSTASADDVWTVQKILHWTAGFLQEKGVESPRLEAELLLAHARQCQRIRLYTDLDVPLTADERDRMRASVKRRAQRIPLSYITGSREFYGRDFVVGPGVLVPRPETETLVDVCLDFLTRDVSAKVCEIGFGSGCISVTLARQLPLLKIIASDISATAMKFASENTKKHGVSDRVHLVAGDLFEPIRTSEMLPLDGIVSNPPYITSAEHSNLAPEVRDHEPLEALVSGEDGLDLVRQIIAEASPLLRPDGWIALEVDPAQCETVSGLLASSGFTNCRIHKDLSQNNRVVSARNQPRRQEAE